MTDLLKSKRNVYDQKKQPKILWYNNQRHNTLERFVYFTHDETQTMTLTSSSTWATQRLVTTTTILLLLPTDTTTKYKLYLKYQPHYEEAWCRWKKWQKDRIKKTATLKRKIVSTNQFNTSSSLSNFLSEKEKEKDKKILKIKKFL